MAKNYGSGLPRAAFHPYSLRHNRRTPALRVEHCVIRLNRHPVVAAEFVTANPLLAPSVRPRPFGASPVDFTAPTAFVRADSFRELCFIITLGSILYIYDHAESVWRSESTCARLAGPVESGAGCSGLASPLFAILTTARLNVNGTSCFSASDIGAALSEYYPFRKGCPATMEIKV